MNSIDYKYRGIVSRVIDGDTIELMLDLGFNISHMIHARLLNYSAPELNEPGGIEAKEFLERLVLNQYVGVHTYKTKDSKNYKMTFTRYLANIFLNGKCINDVLINEYKIDKE
jgi:micrococcal nuclease